MNTVKKKPTPPPRHKYEDARFEICRECKKEWNVSKYQQIPLSGYLCPKCWSKYNK